MSTRQRNTWTVGALITLAGALLLLQGCGSSPGTPTPNLDATVAALLQATRSFETAVAIAAKGTAEALSAARAPTALDEATPLPSRTLAPSSSSKPTQEPTARPIATPTPTRAAVPPTRTPTSTPGAYWENIVTHASRYEGILAFAFDLDGRTWIGAERYFSWYDGTNWSRQFLSTDARVEDILVDDANNVWMAIGNGVRTLQADGSWSTYTAQDGLGIGGVYSMLADESGNLWFAGFGGVTKWDGAQWSQLPLIPGVSTYLDLTFDHTGGLWVLSREADVLARWDGTQWKTLDSDDGVPWYSTCLGIDGTDAIWVGYDHGVMRYDGRLWTDYKRRSDQPSVRGGVLDIAIDAAGQPWFASGSAIQTFSAGQWITYQSPEFHTISVIRFDPKGRLWVGDDHGFVMTLTIG